jgi:hypothetical protein
MNPNRLLFDSILIGLGLYLVLCFVSCEARGETNHERGVRIYNLYKRLDADLKNSCVVLCNMPTGGNVLSEAPPLPTRITVKEPK